MPNAAWSAGFCFLIWLAGVSFADQGVSPAKRSNPIRSWLSRLAESRRPAGTIYTFTPLAYGEGGLDKDGRMEEEIRNCFLWSPFIDSAIHVSVDKGDATLIGRARTWQERDAAQDCAFKGGARAVSNRVEIIGLRQDNEKRDDR